MAVLAWWVIPVAFALLLVAIIRFWRRRPRFRRSFEDVEYFHGFLNALKRHSRESARPDGGPTA